MHTHTVKQGKYPSPEMRVAARTSFRPSCLFFFAPTGGKDPLVSLLGVGGVRTAVTLLRGGKAVFFSIKRSGDVVIVLRKCAAGLLRCRIGQVAICSRRQDPTALCFIPLLLADTLSKRTFIKACVSSRCVSSHDTGALGAAFFTKKNVQTATCRVGFVLALVNASFSTFKN